MWVTVAPETSKIAPGIRDAVRDAERTLPKVTVDVDADTSAAEAQIDAASRDRKATIEVDADTLNASAQRAFATIAGSATSSGAQIGQSMGAGLTPALIAAGVTALAGIASAASGALGLIPAALAGAGTSIGTLVLGLDGVKEAWDAAGKASESSGQDQADQAKAVASAQQSLRNAVQDEANAQKDVADARRDARQQLEDLNVQLRGGALNEKQAALDLAAAKRDLAQGRFRDSIEREQAVLRVQQAEQRQIEVRERNEALVERSAEANLKGVEGSDQVVAANQRLANSQQQVANAQAQLVEAQTKTSTAAQNSAAAMAALSPQAQTLIQTLQGLKPMWEDFQNSIQDSLLAGIGPQIAQLAQTYLPMLQGPLSEMAGLMNQAFTGFAEFLREPATMETISTILANVNESFRQFMPTMETLGQAFLQLTATGSGFLTEFGDVINEVALGFADFVNSGDLGEWISVGLETWRAFTPVAFQILDIFREMAPIGQALLPALGSMFTALQPAIGPLSEVLANMVTFGLGPMLTIGAQLVTTVVQAMAPAMNTWYAAMGPVGQTLMNALLPVLQQLGPVLGEVGATIATELAGAVQQIAPYIGPLAGAFADLLSQLIPMIPTVAQLFMNFSPIFQIALPALTQALLLVMPAFTTFLNIITDAAEVWIPKIQTAITVLGDVFGVAWTAISGAVTTAWNTMKPVLEPLLDILEKIAKPLGFILDNLPDVPGFGGPGARGGAHVPKTGTGWWGGATIPGSVPISQRPDGTWTSPNKDWADLIDRESGGVNQRQKITDSNSGGNEAEGIFQITPSTWVANGGLEFAPSAISATPQQQAIIAGRIFQKNPTGSDWGAGLPGRENPAGLAAGLQTNAGGFPDVLANIPAGKYISEPGVGDLMQGIGDCTSAIEDLVYMWDGKSTAGRSMSTGNATEWLTQNGFVPGNMPGAFNVAFSDSHMQATLPDGTPFNWGSPEAAARRGVGGTGAEDPNLPNKFYRPVDTSQTMGAYPVLGTESSPMYVDYTDGSNFGKNSGGQQLGQDIFSGLMEIFGIDGSVFPDFTQTGMFKGFKGLMGFLTGDGSGAIGGDGASLASPMGGDLGGGLGGVLGAAANMIPQPLGPLKVGGQDRVPAGPIHGAGSQPGPGAPGAGDYRIVQNFNAPVGSPHDAFNAARDANIPRMRQGVRPLPK